MGRQLKEICSFQVEIVGAKKNKQPKLWNGKFNRCCVERKNYK